MTVKRIIGIVAGLLAGAATLAAGPRYDLVPLPKTLVEAPGEFVLNKATALVVEDPVFAEIADFHSNRPPVTHMPPFLAEPY